MPRKNTLLVVLGAALALLTIVACGLLPAATTPTLPAATDTPPAADTATASPSPSPSPLPPSTDTATATPLDTPTATATDIPIVPADTAEPATPLPPSPTNTNTPVPPTPTFTTTPLPPTATPTPIPITDWRGEYYDNPDLEGRPITVSNEPVVDLDLPPGARPVIGLPTDNWSARWSRNWRFDEGNYRFHLVVDDGARLWVGEKLLIDAWTDGPAREFTANLYLAGEAFIRLEYYNNLGGARARLNWEQITQFSGWQGSYFAVRDLSGVPVFQQDDQEINFNWGSGSPRSYLPADNFSVRWTRRLTFDQAGAYRFRAEADDGVRLWVDGSLVIDEWHDGYTSTDAVVTLSAGDHDLRLDYFEHLGGALARLTWAFESGIVTPTATATPANTPLPTPTQTPTPLPLEISLEPHVGELAAPFVVRGSGWPANRQVDLLLGRPTIAEAPPEPVLQVGTDGQGRFEAELVIPEGEGWEGIRSARVVARVAGTGYEAEANYGLLPPLAELRHKWIPALEERFALPERTYLALTSEEAWLEWFGPEPPPVDRPVDWESELILGAFIGPMPESVSLGVHRVVRRGFAVTVLLGIVVPEQPVPLSEDAPVARVLVRVPYDDAMTLGLRPGGDASFVFLDASGRLLAQGTAGPEPLTQAGAGAAVRALEIAPAEEAPAVKALEEPAPQVEAPAESAPGAEEAAPIPEAPAEAEEAAPGTTPADERGPGQGLPAVTLVALLWFGGALALVAVLIVAFLLFRWYRSR